MFMTMTINNNMVSLCSLVLFLILTLTIIIQILFSLYLIVQTTNKTFLFKHQLSLYFWLVFYTILMIPLILNFIILFFFKLMSTSYKVLFFSYIRLFIKQSGVGEYFLCSVTSCYFFVVIWIFFLIYLISTVRLLGPFAKVRWSGYGFYYSVLIQIQVVLYLLVFVEHFVILILLVELLNLLTLFLILFHFKLFYKKIPSEVFGYFVHNCLGSGLLVLGIWITYSSTGYLNFLDVKNFIYLQSCNNFLSIEFFLSLAFFLGFIFIFLGFGFKLGVFPHSWLAGFYHNINLGVVFAMNTIFKFVFLVLFICKIYPIFNSINSLAPHLVYAVGLSSLLHGTLRCVSARCIRSFIFYTSMSTTGWVLISASVSLDYGCSAAIFFAFTDLVVTTGLFVYICNLTPQNKGIPGSSMGVTNIKTLQQLISCENSFFLTTILLSMAGFPPLIHFAHKMVILIILFNSGYYITFLICISSSVYTSFIYGKILFELFLNKNYYSTVRQLKFKFTFKFFYKNLPHIRQTNRLPWDYHSPLIDLFNLLLGEQPNKYFSQIPFLDRLIIFFYVFIISVVDFSIWFFERCVFGTRTFGFYKYWILSYDSNWDFQCFIILYFFLIFIILYIWSAPIMLLLSFKYPFWSCLLKAFVSPLFVGF